MRSTNFVALKSGQFINIKDFMCAMYTLLVYTYAMLTQARSQNQRNISIRLVLQLQFQYGSTRKLSCMQFYSSSLSSHRVEFELKIQTKNNNNNNSTLKFNSLTLAFRPTLTRKQFSIYCHPIRKFLFNNPKIPEEREKSFMDTICQTK